ncbi:MAG: MarR family winged helix-turn-helix transcriptional regulator [Solirubrobacterales bacterium]
MTGDELTAIAGGLLDLHTVLRDQLLRPLEQATSSRLKLLPFRVIRTLNAQGPLSMKELAAVVRISKQQLTPVVNRLAERGWVERENDPSDGRVIRIALTPDGKQQSEQIRDEIIRRFGERLEALDTAERDALQAALTDLNRILMKI